MEIFLCVLFIGFIIINFTNYSGIPTTDLMTRIKVFQIFEILPGKYVALQVVKRFESF